MADYKCIFCDVDGTLLNSKCKILPKTKEIVKRINDMGIPFILVSARMPQAMRPYLEEMGVDEPMICYNGALTLSEKNEVLESIEIPWEAAAEIYQYVSGNYETQNCSVYKNYDWVVDCLENEWVQHEVDIVELEPKVDSIVDYLKKSGSVHKLFCVGEPKESDLLYSRLSQISGEVRVVKSDVNYIEITASAASKASAVQMFCDKNNIDTKNIIAIGDNFNDLDMVKLAGMGVAMGNAPDGVKQHANMVAKTNDEDGIYFALKELLSL